jgi:hypothetical protein
MSTNEGKAVVDFGSEDGLRHAAEFLKEVRGWITRREVQNINGGTWDIDKILDAINEALPPPRIPEPGLWGVVEAHPRATSNRPVRFVCDSMTADEQWVALADGSVWDWDDLIDPTLVRPGIEEGS